MKNKLIIDGSFGEGGGQILRSSLALSILTQTPFTLQNIRAGRKSPGLKKQHLKCIEAAQKLSNATVEGATFKSSTLHFTPSIPQGGEFLIEIGSAGSTMLVLQTVLPVMLMLKENCSVTVTGGTHNPWAPPFEFFRDSFLQQLQKMGAKVSVNLSRYGFFPQGGGSITLTTEPSTLTSYTLLERGNLLNTFVKIINLRKPASIAKQQLETVKTIFSECEEVIESQSPVGPGNAVVLSQHYESITAVNTGLLKRGRKPEITARVTAEKAKEYEQANYVVDQHLTDQLLIPMLLSGGGSFTCAKPTLHSTTNAEVIRLFTGLTPTFTQQSDHWLCEIPAGFTRESLEKEQH